MLDEAAFAEEGCCGVVLVLLSAIFGVDVAEFAALVPVFVSGIDAPALVDIPEVDALWLALMPERGGLLLPLTYGCVLYDRPVCAFCVFADLLGGLVEPYCEPRATCPDVSAPAWFVASRLADVPVVVEAKLEATVVLLLP